MAKGGGKIMMALGAVLALVSGGVVFFIASTATAAPKEIPTKEVLVAREDIPERTVINPDLFVVSRFPEDSIPQNAILATEKDKLKDQYAKEKIYGKTPILLNQVAARKPGDAIAVQPSPSPGAAGASPKPVATQQVFPSFTIDKGKTMVAVDYPEAAKLLQTGILRPGDKVDIYVKAPGASGDQLALIFSNKEVKSFGNVEAATDRPAASPTLIFIDTPQNALVLKFIENMNPFLLIRSADDGDDPRRTDLVTQEYMSARFGLPRATAR